MQHIPSPHIPTELGGHGSSRFEYIDERASYVHPSTETSTQAHDRIEGYAFNRQKYMPLDSIMRFSVRPTVVEGWNGRIQLIHQSVQMVMIHIAQLRIFDVRVYRMLDHTCVALPTNPE